MDVLMILGLKELLTALFSYIQKKNKSKSSSWFFMALIIEFEVVIAFSSQGFELQQIKWTDSSLSFQLEVTR